MGKKYRIGSAVSGITGFRLVYTGYRGPADEDAAVRAAEALIEEHGLTYEELTAETPSDLVKAVFRAAREAAWPERVVDDPSYAGWLEVELQ